MKSIILSWALVAVCTLMTLPVQTQNAVKPEIVDGSYDAGLRVKMEESTSALLIEINRAFKENRALNLVSLGLTDTAERGLSTLWENTHLYCDDSEAVQSCIRNGGGCQVRQIPLMIKPVGETLDDEYQEAVINYDTGGNITCFNFILSTTVYQNVTEKGKTVTETARRQEILSYVEQFRTTYNEQDILFLDNIFSEGTLTITGSVTKIKKTDGTGITYNKVTYKKQGRQEYINNLKKGFRANKWISVRFDDVKVVKHPNPKMEGFYGVTVHQLYANSSSYEDDGYLFMLWDLRDKDQVQIHVRTWQPCWMNDNHTEEVAQEDIFTLGDLVIDL